MVKTRVSVYLDDDEYRFLEKLAYGTGTQTPGKALHMLLTILKGGWKK